MESSALVTRNATRSIGKPKRPIRTYSKRTASVDTPEPVSKKRRIDDASAIEPPENAVSKPACEPSIRQPSPSLPPLQQARKGTIMSYFQIIPPTTSSTLPSSELLSERTECTVTPPSSPPAPHKLKKRRRLTTRIISRSTSEDLAAEDSTEEESEEDNLDRVAIKSSPAEKGGVLSDASADTLNQAASRRKKRSDAGKRGQGSKSTAVQTTLSLSAQEKGFVECKDCNMLYNPLHKQDAKCHARRHAAMLKAKSSHHDNETPG
ncbi:hypothetical protein F4821DRAFT_38907 [Hypoxylon rubiginosum]|uniref:Uncharacterized protein n=1 Tax=Hypoxylon rubiginosum TaxID=110542 RepID=A0ACC0CL51_9PEZI|nr:hypothetical protein F4821DRAFT_38907 [Hypoxylon rubiginosum]